MPLTIVHETTPEQLAQMLRPEGVNPNRFINILVPVSWFCKIHSISYPTLLRWIAAGKVEPEPRDSDKSAYMFRLSYVLTFEPETIRNKHLRPLQ